MLVIYVCIQCGVIYFYKGFKEENRNAKLVSYSFGSFLFGLAFSRIFYFVSVYFLEGFYEGQVFYIDLFEWTPTALTFILLGNLSFMIGMTFSILSLELVLKKTKFAFTMLNLIVIIFFLMLVIFTDFQVMVVLLFISYSFVAYVVLIIKISNYSDVKYQPVTVLIIGGLYSIVAGFFFFAETIQPLEVSIVITTPLYISPLMYLVGIILIISPNFIKHDYFKETLRFWVLVILYFIFDLSIGIYSLIYVMLPTLLFVAYLIGIAIDLLIIAYSITRIKKIRDNKNIVRQPVLDTEEENILKSFFRPQKVTEEEVSISKEKKICLVCKSNIARFNIYICPDCNAYYCEKCASTLTNHENACWMCNTPFDEQKPSKPAELEETELKIEEEVKSKKFNPKKPFKKIQ